jgi:hypothetical protein
MPSEYPYIKSPDTICDAILYFISWNIHTRTFSIGVKGDGALCWAEISTVSLVQWFLTGVPRAFAKCAARL